MAEIPSQVQQEVEQRLSSSEGERERTHRSLITGQILEADTSNRLEKRKVRLLSDRGLAAILGRENREALASGPVLEAPEAAQRAFERQIGGNDAQPCWFLTRGAEIRRTVGRIHIRDASRRLGWGTGFLVGPNLLVTNQHVLDSLETTKFSRVEFEYEETFSGELLLSAVFDLAPDILFISDPAVGGLDYVLVAVSPQARPESTMGNAELAGFGYNVLSREEGKLLKGELIHTIHHPEGQPRQVCLRENRLMALADPALEGSWMHYETDTERGSSGAPLYNSQWEVVGIHHSGVEKRDDQGRILAVGGGLWSPEMGERLKWWYANEGLRISRFVAHTESQVKAALDPSVPPHPERIVTEAGRALFEVMLKPTQSRPDSPPSPIPTVGGGATTPQVPRPRFNPE